MSGQKEKEEAFDQFQTIVLSLLKRVYELSIGNATFFQLMLVDSEFRLQDLQGELCKQTGCEAVFQHLREINEDQLHILRFSYARNSIVTTVSIFDSFLSDLTKFLLILFPETVSKDRQVKVGDVVNCKSVSEVLDTILGKLVYEISYKSIRARIQYLDQSFGIRLATYSGLIDKVQHFSELRNVLIHDISTYHYKSERYKGRLKVIERPEAQAANWDTAKEVLEACEELIDAIFVATSKRVFKREPNAKVSTRPSL